MAFKKGRKGPKSRFNRFNHNHDSGFSRLNANPVFDGALAFPVELFLFICKHVINQMAIDPGK